MSNRDEAAKLAMLEKKRKEMLVRSPASAPLSAALHPSVWLTSSG